ncbi:MAG: outer membrane lipoprotein carrier protein LolA [Gammaproteobacteria bacterium]|nr:MAG: outer membrane lipoprotein carrier protein LolA [Gammaproteobacteria bacterium]
MLLPLLVTARSDDAELAALMSRLAAVPERRVAFTEEQTSSLLDVPLVQSGSLYYRRPDYLERQVGQRRAIIDGERVILDDGQGQRREIGLDDLPLLRAFVASFRALLAGDLEALRRHYRVALDRQGAQWHVRLEPRDARMRAVVSGIEVEGQGDRPERFVLLETNGDRTVTEFRTLQDANE